MAPSRPRRRSLCHWRCTPALRGRQHAHDGHHAVILMPEDVAVIDEITDIRSAEVHADSDARIGARAGPVWDLVHVVELLLLRWHWHAVHRQQQEMDLVL